MSDPVAYTAVLPVAGETVQFVSRLLAAERRRRGTRGRRRALGCFRQALLVLRWFVDGTRRDEDHDIGRSTAYQYLHEALDVIAAHAPDLDEILRRAQAAALPFVCLDGTLVSTDRIAARAERGHHLWYSGKHHAFGGTVQVLTDPTGFPLWVSRMRPGSTHDLTAATAHTSGKPRSKHRSPLMGTAFVHTVLDDHSRSAYAEIHDDEVAATAIGVLRRAVAWFAAHGVAVERVLSDNGSAYRSRAWRDTCRELGITPKRTRPYRPQTNC